MEITGHKWQFARGKTIAWWQTTRLGNVKFLFPNSYDIYLHDTPNRNLFSATNRNFSHGCIRIQDPKKMAMYLLRNDNSWTEERIDSCHAPG